MRASAWSALRRLLALASAFACALAFVLLLEGRPAAPPLPRPLSSPITLELVRGALTLAAWGACVALAAVLLVRSLQVVTARSRRPTPRPHVPLRRRPMPLAQARLAAGAGGAEFPPPFPLVLRARSDTTSHAERVHELREPPPAEPAQGPQRPSIGLLGPVTIAPLAPRSHSRRAHAQPLLVYLSLHREGATPDELTAALWSQLDGEKARKRLWGSISDARVHLGDVILRSGERYRLDRDAVTIDIDQFEALLAKADNEDGDRRQLLERALLLVRGEPLAGSDYPWALGEIRRLRATIIDRLTELGQLRLDDRQPASAIAAAEQAIALDPFNEPAHRLAMKTERALGLRQAIAERYEQLARELDTRFGLEPERETRLLYRSLLSSDAAELRRS